MVKGQGHSKTTCGQRSTLGGIFLTCLWNAWTYWNSGVARVGVTCGNWWVSTLYFLEKIWQPF